MPDPVRVLPSDGDTFVQQDGRMQYATQTGRGVRMLIASGILSFLGTFTAPRTRTLQDITGNEVVDSFPNVFTAPQAINGTGGSISVNDATTTATTASLLSLSTTSGGGFQIAVSDRSLANPVWNVQSNASEHIAIAAGGSEHARFLTTGQQVIGYTATVQIGATANSDFQLFGTSTHAGMNLARWSADTVGFIINVGKSRSATIATPTIVTTGDNLFQFIIAGDDGTNLASNAARLMVDCEGTPAAGVIPGRFRFQTASAAGTLLEALRLDSGQGAQIRTSYSATSPGSGQLVVRGHAVDEQNVSTTGNIAALASDTGLVRLTGAAPVIQGITAPTLGDAVRRVYCTNSTTFNNEDAAATAANRVHTGTGAAVVFGADSVALLIYDSTTLRWRFT